MLNRALKLAASHEEEVKIIHFQSTQQKATMKKGGEPPKYSVAHSQSLEGIQKGAIYWKPLRGQVQQGEMHSPHPAFSRDYLKVWPIPFPSHTQAPQKWLHGYLLYHLSPKGEVRDQHKLSSIVGSSDGFLRRGWTSTCRRGGGTAFSLKEELITLWTA